ncbi:MAG: TonB-dependent receptor plug domain-containing protein [Bacteroidales bacterium]|nr:TonB-dependent receptor plug domain-containing protein [Bacteroidales bacterium]
MKKQNLNNCILTGFSLSIAKFFGKVVLLLMLSSFARAQTSTLSLKDAVTGKAVPFATVCFEDVLSGKQSCEISDEKGTVTSLAAGKYLLSVSCLGYQIHTDTLLLTPNLIINLEPSYFALDQVVVTGTIKPRMADNSIYKINVYNRNEIKNKAAGNLTELVSKEPNIQISRNGVLGSSMSINGLSGEHIKILINGVPVAGRQNGIIDLNHLNLNNVDHIETIEGPMSVIYGSNAMAGTINIITREFLAEKYVASVQANYESVGIYRLNGNAAFRKNNHSFSLNLARNFSSGFGLNDTSRYKIWKPTLQYDAGFNYAYQNNKSRLSIKTQYLNEELHDNDSLRSEFLYEEALDKYYYTHRLNSTAEYQVNFNKTLSLQVTGGHSFYQRKKITYLNDLVNLVKTRLNDPDEQDTTTIGLISQRSIVAFNPVKSIETQAGYDITYESGNGKRIQGEQNIGDYALFFTTILKPFNNLDIQPGLRLIHNSKYEAPVVYSLNTKWNIADFRFRFSYGKGFRTPTLKELYLEFVDGWAHNVFGNENLKAETAQNLNFNAGYAKTFTSSSVEFELGIFYNKMKNKIDFLYDANDPTWAQYFNIDFGNYINKGINAQIQYKFHPWLTLKIGTATLGNSKLDNLSTFTYSTNFSSSVLYTNAKYGFGVNLFYKYNDDYRIYNGETNVEGEIVEINESYIDGYHDMDFIINYSILHSTLNISSGIKNIFNNTLIYSSGSGAVHGGSGNSTPVGWGRTFFVQLSYNFRKY